MPISETLPARLIDARRLTDQLFGLIDPEALYERPIAERHRFVFYLGHLEAFDRNLLRSRLRLPDSVDAGLDRLFAFGIDPVDGNLPSDSCSDWPALNVVRDYATRAREELNESLGGRRIVEQERGETSIEHLLEVAIEHRLMHLETLSYMLHQLSYDKKRYELQPAAPKSAESSPGLVPISSGTATLGLSSTSRQFGWDNEFDEHVVHVPAFSIDRYKVTNREYLNYVRETGVSPPIFWMAGESGWTYKGMFEAFPLPMDSPVYVSHAEATTYARWAGKRLPTEAEWHRAAYGVRTGREHLYPWGSSIPGPSFGYFQLDRWDPSPVNAFPEARSDFGVHNLLANGWEWTSTIFRPFPGFRPFSFYPGYSANFFDEQHYVMKGGSPRTEKCMLRRSFRNWFQAHYPYIYAGLRCVESGG